MKIGDMVQYVHHSSWEHSGLGIITDQKEAFLRSGETILAFQIAWFDVVEEYGWNETIMNHAGWYDDADFEKDIKLFVEAL